MHKAIWLAALLLVTLVGRLHAQLLEVSGDLRLDQTNAVARTFTFGGGKMVIQLEINTRPGTVAVALKSPDGRLLGSQTGGILTIGRWELTSPHSGTHTLLVTPHQTAGHWRVRIDSLPSRGLLNEQACSGGLMILAALGGVMWWRRRSGVAWRWFWAGAAIWTVGVALKFAVAVPLNPIVIGAPGHPARPGLAAGITYCGLMTGIFEIGVTLAAALIWRTLAAEPKRAVAIGLGAGGFEALLLGLAAAVGSLAAVVGGHGDQALQGLGGTSAATPLLWLAGPTERLIAIATHTAARVLVLQAVSQRSWLGFWAGFAWLSLMDAVAGAVLLTGLTTSLSVWWIELMLVPFGVLSIPLTRYALDRWAVVEPAMPAETSVP